MDLTYQTVESSDTPGSKMGSNVYGTQRHINDNYDVVGFISSGTYGRVYKAKSKGGRHVPPAINQVTGRPIEAFAIKKYGFTSVLSLLFANCLLDSSQTRTAN